MNARPAAPAGDASTDRVTAARSERIGEFTAVMRCDRRLGDKWKDGALVVRKWCATAPIAGRNGFFKRAKIFCCGAKNGGGPVHAADQAVWTLRFGRRFAQFPSAAIT